ncbi:MAG TPA: M56 family metallopeptidase, partial [Verrucomicrobiae bacterium]|nr:M56 family metallopeptidase [Verrucomicrobiae bacterium]
MNAIETLNHWGARLLDFALPMLAQSSVLIVALFALDLVLRNRVRAVIRYALWMLVLIKLVLPPSFAAPTGLAYWLPEKKAAQAKPAITPQFVVRYSDIQFDAAPVLPSLSPPPPRLQFAAWLLLSWLGITVGLLTLLARRSHLISTITRRAVPAPASPEQLLDDCRAQMKIKRRVRLRLSRHASSPAVYGLWRPVVLIPQQLADKLSALQLRAVLLHELAHIKRGDVWVHHAQTLLQILYWWHPLLWLANTRIRRVREQAVDEMVMVQMGVEAEAYPATLLEVAKLAFKRPMLALGLIGIVESKSALAQRIHRLVNHPVPRSSRLGLAGLAPLLLAGAAFLPMARGQRTLSQPPPIASESAPVVAMDVRFIEIEERPLATLGLGEPPLIEPNGHRAWVLTSEQLNEVCQRAVEQAGTDVLTAPRVTTVSGRQTQVQVVDIIPVAGTEIRVGPTCDLTPYVTGDLIDLAVATSVTERRPVDPAAPFTSVTEAFLTNDVGTARVIVEDGGGVVLENPEARSSKGNRYLVMVSATLASADHTSESQTPDQASVAPPASMRAAARTQEVPAAITGNPTQPRPANSPNNRPAEPVTVSQGATTRFESSTGHEVVIEAIRPAEIQYDYESGTCVVTNDFVARFKDAVLTARRGQINSKTGEVIADGDVILQRGDQVLRCERLEYNFIHQKITGTSTSSGAASSSAPARSQVENNVVPMPPANGAQDQPADAATKGDASEFESEQLTVTIAKTEPHLYFRSEPVTVEELKTRLQRAADRNPAATLSLQADTDAPFG